MSLFRRRSGKKWLLIVCSLIIIVICLYYLFTFSYRLDKITVKGLTYYEEQEFVSQICSEKAKNNTILFWLEQKTKKQKKVPYIEKYDWKCVGRHEVEIEVYEKILIGCVKVMGEYLYFDKDGTIVESMATQMEDIPLVIGLSYDSVVMYSRLDIEKDKIYGKILNITRLLHEYGIKAQSLSFDSRENATLEVGMLTVKLGKSDVYDIRIQKFADIVSSLEGRYLEVDLSSYQGNGQDIVARPKN